MASRITSLCIDCSDAETLAEFWADVLGWEVKDRGWQSRGGGPCPQPGFLESRRCRRPPLASSV